MITIKKRLKLSLTYPLERLGIPENLLFFDIETTGFSAASSRLYLIGCIFYKNHIWNLIQWFADTTDSEKYLFDAFFTFSRQFSTLIHFNGDSFDLPYLQKRCVKLGLTWNLSNMKSIDIYKRIKPYRKLLGMDSLKQKSVERFLGISRTDTFSGKELIQVYSDYLISQNQSLCDLLILHNEDDLKGMPAILPILGYPDFWEHPFLLNAQTLCQEPEEDKDSPPILKLICQSKYQIPVPFTVYASPVRCFAAENQLHIWIELFSGTLKHFYPNYKEYYYLPYEDTAIHKSIGEYVDKSARIKATAKTCYTKKKGIFLPQFEPIWEPAMKQDHKDWQYYVSLSDLHLEDPDRFQHYLSLLQRHLKKSS